MHSHSVRQWLSGISQPQTFQEPHTSGFDEPANSVLNLIQFACD
jgi:hypothetical protein